MSVTTLSAPTSSFQITVLPPCRSDGVASMLVALGDARIGVTHAEVAGDNRGAYTLACRSRGDSDLDYAALAALILGAIGCTVERVFV
jgi:hypothetical protein